MIVALLTDFGTRDHYVGTMKAVVLSVCPSATLVDITHDIAPQDILAAALELDAAWQYFPAGTVFLVVVDPGVGTTRRAIACDAGGYRFVGPDNGVLSLVTRQLARDSGRAERQPLQIVELREPKFARKTISRTFEGRDRFAPAAGWLARGTPLHQFGPPVHDPVVLDVPLPRLADGVIEGQVVRVDRFGNLITNVDEPLLRQLGDQLEVTVGALQLSRIVATYGDVQATDACALVGSSGYLEIAINGGNAAHTLRLGRGAAVRIRQRV